MNPQAMQRGATPGDPVYEATGLVYRLRPGQPNGPLIVLLHGLGGDEEVMWIFERALPEEATVISPRAPIAIVPGLPYAEDVDSGYSWLRPAPPPQIDRPTFATALEVLQRLVETAVETYPVDSRRVILVGFSQGATMSYALSLNLPDRIAGVVALAGFMPEDEDGHILPAAHHTPPKGYLILHGLEDERVPIDWARKAQQALEALGANVEYHEYPVGHKVSPPGLKDMAAWLKRVLGAES